MRATHSLRGSMVTGREWRELAPPSVMSGGESNSREWALCEASGWGWAMPGLAKALLMRMCRGTAGGWPGGSVVGLGGSVCTTGTGPEAAEPGVWRDCTLGGDGGMWEGGKAGGSVGARGAAEFVLSSLTAGAAAAGTAAGSVLADSGR